MGTGLIWEAMEMAPEEYEEVLSVWKDFDLWEVVRKKDRHAPALHFIFDEEIMSIPHLPDYFRRCREKYQSRFFKKK